MLTQTSCIPASAVGGMEGLGCRGDTGSACDPNPSGGRGAEGGMVGDHHQTSPPRTKRGAERPPAQTEGASLPGSPDERPPRTFRKTWTASTCVASCSTPEPHGGEGRANSDCSDASGPGGRRRPPQVCDASALRTGIRKRTQRAEPREQGLKAAAGAPHALSLGGTPAQPPGWGRRHRLLGFPADPPAAAVYTFCKCFYIYKHKRILPNANQLTLYVTYLTLRVSMFILNRCWALLHTSSEAEASAFLVAA